ncbi:hypothetical protein EVAR_38088_1 [Eumeta japonica]|uniref:Secreted protein n=1 Tax=Eumeta variegata TaxID=151549 RepID=A0A4C1W9Y3_EUMVA|nr:hypothetical protein EVAR_38088_1 [Eumeta japonica]
MGSCTALLSRAVVCSAFYSDCTAMSIGIIGQNVIEADHAGGTCMHRITEKTEMDNTRMTNFSSAKWC